MTMTDGFVCISGIMLAFTKRNPIEIAESIRNLDSELNSVEFIQHLIQYIPNETEVMYFQPAGNHESDSTIFIPHN